MPPESPDTPSPLAEISQGPSAFEQFLDRNQKSLVVVAILIALGTAAFVVINGIEKSRQQSAGAVLVKATEIQELEALITEHSGTRAALSAAVILANKQWDEGKQSEAISTLEGFLSENPDHPAAATAKASLASKWMAQGKSAEAVAAFQELADTPETRHLAPYALLNIGDIAMAAGDKTKAKEAYTRITADFPESAFVSTANNRLSHLEASLPVAVDPPKDTTAPTVTGEADATSTAPRPESHKSAETPANSNP